MNNRGAGFIDVAVQIARRLDALLYCRRSRLTVKVTLVLYNPCQRIFRPYRALKTYVLVGLQTTLVRRHRNLVSDQSRPGSRDSRQCSKLEPEGRF